MSVRESQDHCSFNSFPGLFAVFYALLRLLMPRHPPYTLNSLIRFILNSFEPLSNYAQTKMKRPRSHRCESPLHPSESLVTINWVGFISILSNLDDSRLSRKLAQVFIAFLLAFDLRFKPVAFTNRFNRLPFALQHLILDATQPC